MVRQSTFAVSLIALLVIFFIGFFFLELQLKESATVKQSEFASWIAKVYMVGQPGSTERYVTRWLGKPDITMRIHDAERMVAHTGTRPVIPGSADHALFYEGSPSGWMVYYFIGPRGEVLGYLVRLT